MSDAGGGGGGEADLSGYGIDWGLGELGISGDYGIDTGLSEPSPDLGYGAGEGLDVSLGDFDLSLGGGRAGGGLTSLLTGAEGGGSEVEKPIPGPELKEVKADVAEQVEKPVIRRARRRRSILTEAEGGILRKPTVHRRSILGRP